MNLEYWYVFPFAVCVATVANASGFSGSVLFQPFFYFVLKIPFANSIATGIATETLGMTSGTFSYAKQKLIIKNQLPWLALFTIIGVLFGLLVFKNISQDYLRLIVGLVVFVIASMQLKLAFKKKFGNQQDLPPHFIHRWGLLFSLAGFFSACTGTGVAEISQPTLEQKGRLSTLRANATAIFLESIADWVITLFNLQMGNINLSILLFSGTGVILGAQIGARLGPRLPKNLLKVSFSIALILISSFYIYRFIHDVVQVQP